MVVDTGVSLEPPSRALEDRQGRERGWKHDATVPSTPKLESPVEQRLSSRVEKSPTR